MNNFSIGKKPIFTPNNQPLFTPNKPVTPQQSPEPFKAPDVFQPAQPNSQPYLPSQPMQFPSSPIAPGEHFPGTFPMELPSLPDQSEWNELPTPQEIPDWSTVPWELPNLPGPEVNIPKSFPTPDSTPPGFPPNTWLFS